MSSVAERIKEAILHKIEGARDFKTRLDYLMKPEFLETSARLSETQVQAISEMAWLGKTFPTLKPLADLGRSLALWSISQGGKGREDAISLIMASEHKELLGALGITVPGPGQPQEKEGKGKK